MMVVATLVGAVAWMLGWGWVFMKIWEWFVHPLGLPVLGLGNALGVSLLFAMVNEASSAGEKDAAYVASVILRPLFVLVIGWIVKTVSA